MGTRRVLIVAGLPLAALVVVALAYTLWAGSSGDRPTLMYFRADL